MLVLRSAAFVLRSGVHLAVVRANEAHIAWEFRGWRDESPSEDSACIDVAVLGSQVERDQGLASV